MSKYFVVWCVRDAIFIVEIFFVWLDIRILKILLLMKFIELNWIIEYKSQYCAKKKHKSSKIKKTSGEKKEQIFTDKMNLSS